MKGYFAFDGIGPWLICSAMAHGVLIAELPWQNQSPEIAVNSGSAPLHVSLVTPSSHSPSKPPASSVNPSKPMLDASVDHSDLAAKLPMPVAAKPLQKVALSTNRIITSSSQQAAFAVLTKSSSKNDSDSPSLPEVKTLRAEPAKVPVEKIVAKVEPTKKRVAEQLPVQNPTKQLEGRKAPLKQRVATKAVEAKKPKKYVEKPSAQQVMAKNAERNTQLPQKPQQAMTLPKDTVEAKTAEEPVAQKPVEVVTSEIDQQPDSQILTESSFDTVKSSSTQQSGNSQVQQGGGNSSGQDQWMREAKGALTLALGDRFSYPPKARKRHWQGEVLLQVSLNADGSIGQVELLRSSGHRLLDRDAMRSIKSIGQLALVELDRELQIQIPVSYQLTGR